VCSVVPLCLLRERNEWPGNLVKEFQDKYPHTIEKGNNKNTFKGLSFIKMDIDREENRVGEQGKSAHVRDHFIVMYKIIKELLKTKGREFEQVNDKEADKRPDKTQDQTEPEIIFC
jgi:hypothetical protein